MFNYFKNKQTALRTRALLVSILVIVVFFSLAGIALQRAFSSSVDQRADSALQATTNSLLATLDFDNQERIVFDNLPTPELALANSGIYAEIWDGDRLLWRSGSLIGQPLARLPARQGRYQFYPLIKENKRYLMTLLVDWSDINVNRQFTVITAIDSAPYELQLRGYNQTLIIWLTILTLLLLLFLAVLFAWLFRPLRRVVEQLKQLETGERDKLDDDFPRELNSLTGSINAYINHEKEQIKNQKKSLGNLAHSLKTPLAIIRSQLSTNDDSTHIIDGQLEHMSQAIEYQLTKATSSARQRYVKAIPCNEAIKRVIDTIATLNKGKSITIIQKIEDELVFFGDEGDLIEVMGNLLENACKWCHSTVIISAQMAAKSTEPDEHQRLHIKVIDDGPGIAAEQLELVLQRGKRLDEQVQGHGIGLSIVSDIVDSYQGQINFSSSHIDIQSTRIRNGLTVGITL